MFLIKILQCLTEDTISNLNEALNFMSFYSK